VNSDRQPLVSIRGLSVFYDGDERAALNDVDLDIFSGERLAIIGESGSGKSTLALAIAGLLPATARTSGKIGWPGFYARNGREPQGGRDVGFIFQEASASLDPVMPVGRQVAEVAHAHLGLSWPEAGDRAEALLARVRLPDPATAMHAYPHQLSGGQKQRVAIAAAIAAGPRLLIADEATSALDAIVQAEIIGLIRHLTQESGMTLLFVSHDIALAARLADRIAVFCRGELVELGDGVEIIRRPRHAYTRALLAALISLDSKPLLRGSLNE